MADEQITIHKGLDGVVIDETKLSLVNGSEGHLMYSGYKIEDLAAHALYEEVVFLLWHGRLPDAQELESLRAQIAANAEIPKEVIAMLETLPSDSNPMAVLRTAVSMLAHYDIDSEVMTPEANERKAIRLNGQVASLVAAWPRIRKGLAPHSPRKDFTVAQNFVYQLTGELPPSKEAVDAINTFMVLLTEHGMNVSTFTTRVIASSLSDMHSAITGAIGSLKGPLHGGANTEAMNMFLEIGSPDNVEQWFDENIKTGKRRIMGIGHRIYKALDPRAAVLRERAEALAKASGNSQWFEVADKLAQLARADQYFIERNLYPNVDYFSAIALYTLDIPVDMFTPLFAMSRIAGWTAHYREQMAANRLVRPDVLYTGPDERPWLDLADR